MNIYECAPQKNFKKLSGLVMILICVALGLFLLPNIFPTMPFRWAPQLLGLGCLSAVIYISVRRVGRALVYRIVEDDGERFLTVTEVTNGGRTHITVCRIGLDNIEAVYALDKRNDTDKISIERLNTVEKRGRKVFNYHPDMMPAEVCYVFATECGEPLMIKLGVDGTLVQYLKKEVDSRVAE